MELLNYKDEKLEKILSVLVPEFKPTATYLFGSRAKGTAHTTSDYDLFLVVEKSNLEPRDRVFRAREMLWGTKGAIDIFIYTQKEFDEWKDEFSSIPHTVFTEGLKLEFI